MVPSVRYNSEYSEIERKPWILNEDCNVKKIYYKENLGTVTCLHEKYSYTVNLKVIKILLRIECLRKMKG